MKIKSLIIALFLLVLLIPYIVMGGTQTASGLTGANIIAAARYRLGAISASSVTDPFYSDTEMIRWVNDGLYDICKKTGALQTTEAETLVAATVEYALTSLYFEIVGVVLNKTDGTKVGLKKGNIWSVGQTDIDFKPAAQKVPGYWYEFGGKVGVYPPYSTVSKETITAYLSIIPAVIASDGAVPTPGMYDKALILYVEAQGHKKAGNLNAYNATMEEYYTELGIDKTNTVPSEKEQEVVE